MSQYLSTGSKKWRLIGKQKAKTQQSAFQLDQKNNQSNLENIYIYHDQSNMRDNMDRLTSFDQQVSSSLFQSELKQNKYISARSSQKKDIIYESQQVLEDPYQFYNVATQVNILGNISNDHSDIIQSISFHEELKKYQDSSLIHELSNFKDSNANFNINVEKKGQQINNYCASQLKRERILKNIIKLNLSLDVFKKNKKKLILEINKHRQSFSDYIFEKNKQFQNYLISKLNQMFLHTEKNYHGNSKQIINESFMKGFNESMQILQTSERELKSVKIIQTLMKSLQQNEMGMIQLRKKLTLKQLQNNRIIKQCTDLKDQNISLVIEKQQLLEQVFCLQQQIVGIELQIEEKVKNIMARMQQNYEQKQQKQPINNQVYLSTIQQLSKQITVLNQKCLKYENFIINKKNVLTLKFPANQQNNGDFSSTIQKQAQAKQKYLLNAERQLKLKQKKINDYELKLNSLARDIDQHKQFIVQKQQQLNNYNLELNQKQKGLSHWEKTLEEEQKFLDKKINNLQRHKLNYKHQFQKEDKNLNFSPNFGEKLLRKNDSIINYHKKSISNLSSCNEHPFLIQNNQDYHDAYYENFNENEQKRKYHNNLSQNNKVLLWHKQIAENKQKSYSNLYSSHVHDKKSLLVNDILVRRRKEVNKFVNNKKIHKSNLLSQGIFTETQMQKIKSPTGQNYKINQNRSSFNLSNHNDYKQKFHSRQIYDISLKSKASKFSRDISGILPKTNLTYQKHDYKKFDKKSSRIDNINQKLQKLKEQIKKQVNTLQ